MKTMSLSTTRDDGPFVSLCPGHVGAVAFNKAHRKEGWSGDWVRKEELSHEYWVKLKSNRWKKASEKTKKAKPFTAMYW